jgi:hypothetical protein
MKRIVIALSAICFMHTLIFADQTIATSAALNVLEGVDSLTGERAQMCATASSVKTVDRPQVSISAEYVTSAEQMYRSIGVNAAAKFGGIGQSARIQFGMSSDQFFDAHHEVLAIVESVSTSAKVAVPPFVLPGRLRSSDAMKETEFRKACGTGFVSEVMTGGRFTVLLRSDKMNAVDANQLRADVHLAFGASSGDASFQQATKHITENSSLQVYMVQMGSEANVPALTAAAMIKAAQEFPSVIKKAGITTSVTLTPYSAAGRPMARDLDAENRERILYEIESNFDHAYDLHRALDAVINNDPDYSFQNKAAELQTLTRNSESTADYIDKIPEIAKLCLDRAQRCSLRLVPHLPKVAIPKTLVEAGGGCYRWNSTLTRCEDFRMSGGSGPVLNFTAQMVPDKKYNVVATGRIFPDTPDQENMRDIRSIDISVFLQADNAQKADNKSFRHWQDPDWRLSLEHVPVGAGGLPIRLEANHCFWVSDKNCPLKRMRVSITPESEPIPVTF